MKLEFRSKLENRKLGGFRYIICLLFGMMACDSEKKSSSANLNLSGPFMGQSDLKPPEGEQVVVLDESDFVLRLTKHYDHFRQEKYEDDTGPAESEYEEMLDAIPIKGTKSDEILIEAVLDLTGPLEDEFNKMPDFSRFKMAASVNKATVKVYTWIQCEGVDLSSLHGKKSHNVGIDIDKMCASANSKKILGNMSYYADFKMTISDGDFSFVREEIVEDIFGLMDEKGGACSFVSDGDEYYLSNGCVEIEKTVNHKKLFDGQKEDDHGKINFFKKVFRSIKENKKNDSDSWYHAGVFESQIENWTGTVTFTDANVAPTYSFSNGTINKSGSFEGLSPRSSLELTKKSGSANKKIAQEYFKKIISKSLKHFRIK